MCFLPMPSTAITHNSCFTANDVFSAALLKCINPKIKIIRASGIPENFTGLIYGFRNTPDIHQNKKNHVRRNRIPYSSFGLLWKDYGRFLINNEEGFQYFDDHFVQELDLAEYSFAENSLIKVINNFNPQNTEDEDKMFWQAENIAEKILRREIQNVYTWMEAKEEIKNKLKKQKSDDPVLIMEKSVPFQDLLVKTNIRFVIHPIQGGRWKVSVIRHFIDGSDVSVYFPEEWTENAGIPVTMKGLLSCDHKGMFIITDSIQSARKACMMTMEHYIRIKRMSFNLQISN